MALNVDISEEDCQLVIDYICDPPDTQTTEAMANNVQRLAENTHPREEVVLGLQELEDETAPCDVRPRT